MIEKIMKVVKRGNKKRGRNITIGAVVGMLLSCTAVMGAGEIGLDITKGDTEIEFSKDGNKFEPEKEGDPYLDNTWVEGTKTYTNNTMISAENTSGYAYGVKIDENDINIVNNGTISGISKDGYGYGIHSLSTGSITNDGFITASGTAEITGNGYGICNSSSSITNNGLITSMSTSSSHGIDNIEETNTTNNGLVISVSEKLDSGGSGYGIYYRSEKGNIENSGSIIAIGITNSGSGYANGCGIENISAEINITNSGFIRGTGTAYGTGYGIENSNNIINVINNGLIIGSISKPKDSSNGFGIYNLSTNGISAITNSGVVYGKTNAITNKTGKITAANYGILISGSDEVVSDNLTLGTESGENKILNSGLAFTVDETGSYKNHSKTDTNHNFGNTYEDVTIGETKYTIRNIQATVASGPDGGTISEIKSFGIKDGELYEGIAYDNVDASSITGPINDGKATIDKVILNGIENTLKVVGNSESNSLSNAIINAYGTGIEFGGTNGGSLTLTGTTVNGGIKEIEVIGGKKEKVAVILGSSKADTLVLENTVINGNIDMGAGDDNLTIGSGTIINGTLDGGVDAVVTALNGTAVKSENDTLKFGTADSSSSKETRVFYDISNFENINVNSNVTFYEKTADADGKIKNLEVTGAGVINIGKNGVLTLRIDPTNKTGEKIKGHALYGNNGTITSEGGKLLLALNGAGNESVISFGDTELGAGLNAKTLRTTSKLHILKKLAANEVEVTVAEDLSDEIFYEQLNKIYHSILSIEDLIGNFNVDDDAKLSTFLGYLNDIYAGNPYSYSSELSRKSTGMFRDIVTENIFRPETNKWMIYGGLTHIDGGTKDTYYGKGYYTYDIGSNDMDADTKITGAYMLGEYGISDTLTSGVVIGGNKLKSDLSNGSKVDGSALYLGVYAKKYIGNLKVTAGTGFQYGDYDTDRMAINKVASDSAESVMKYSDNYNDMTYDIYLNGRYSHNIGDNLFLEPYATLSYTYIDQDGANEGNKTLTIETDSKSFDYTVGKVGVDLKKVIPHEKGKSTLSAGVSYTKILDGADEEHITGRFKGGSDFDILVAHKNKHSIGLNAKYALELENGVIFDVKGTYSVERDSHNGSGKNKTKGEWIVGAGLGYKF